MAQRTGHYQATQPTKVSIADRRRPDPRGRPGYPPRTNETYLEPVLEAMLDQFPCPIPGFHTDNGSEFISLLPQGRQHIAAHPAASMIAASQWEIRNLSFAARTVAHQRRGCRDGHGLQSNV